MAGRLIVVEGLEGAGKSTAMKYLKPLLTELVGEVVSTHEPGGTPVADALRSLIKQSLAEEVLDPRTELLLLYAARVQLVERVIRPALARGAWVLSDRFELSTEAYQGGGRNLSEAMIAQLSAFCLQGLQPDLILFLDIEPRRGLERVVARGKRDRIEQESLSFFEAVAARYHAQLAMRDNVVMIDANASLDVVATRIERAVCDYLKHVDLIKQ